MTSSARQTLRDIDVVSLGPFRFDRAARSLTRGAEPIALGSRALDILDVLTDHAPNIVSKAALMDRVWSGDFVEEAALRFHMSSLRRALGVDELGQSYVSTASGRGYRLTVPVGRVCGKLGVELLEAPPNASTTPNNLRPVLSDLIGRSSDLRTLAAELTSVPMITLSGPGGVGKTRLALELAHDQLAAFPGGVWLIDLAPLEDSKAIVGALAAAMGISVSSPERLIDSIVATLGKARSLLILDNCEHLTEAAAALTQTLLDLTASVTVLATSQASLHIAAERLYSLNPLSTPLAGVAEVAVFSAVQLFVQRAKAADRTFALTTENSAAIGEICRKLDGLPLALEIAARRVRLLGVEGLRNSLASRLQVLNTSAHGHARHASLRNMLEWSYNQLSPLDQRVFRALATFPAGFTLQDAAAVASRDDSERWEVVESVSRLIDHSLLQLQRREPTRFHLLETLRLYASELLQEAGEADQLGERHALHYIRVFDEMEGTIDEMPATQWLVLHQPEVYNLRAALEWALAEKNRAAIAVQLASRGLMFLRNINLISEGREFGERTVPRLTDQMPPLVASRLLNGAAICFHQSGSKMGAEYAARAEVLCRAADDMPGLVTALTTLALSDVRAGRLSDAQRRITEGGKCLDLVGPSVKSRFLNCCGILLIMEEKYTEAIFLYMRILDLVHIVQSRDEAAILTNLGLCKYMTGDMEGAIALSVQAYELAKEKFASFNCFRCSSNVSAFLIQKLDLQGARVWLSRAFEYFSDGGVAERHNHFRLWANLLCEEGRQREAAQLFGFAEAMRASLGLRVEPAERRLYDRLTVVLEMALDPTDLAACKAVGAVWSEPQAIAVIMDSRELQSRA